MAKMGGADGMKLPWWVRRAKGERTAWVIDFDKRSCNEFGKVSYLR